jgi:hypothetical protein
VWAVGYFHKEGPLGTYAQTLTEHWDGQAWAIVPSPDPSTGDNFLYGVKAVAHGDVWAVGDAYNVETALTLHWDGESWVVFPGPQATSLKHLFAIDGTSADDLWSAGYHFDTALDFNQPLFGHWDGQAWSTYAFSEPQTEEQAYGIAVINADDAWIVGRTGTDADVSGVFAQHWDGAAWSDSVAGPVAPGDLNILSGAAALSSADVWAAGYFTVSDGQTVTSRPLLENWNGEGTTWTVVDTPDPGAGDAKLAGITAIPGTSELWAVGSKTDPQTSALRTMALQDCPIQVNDTGFSPTRGTLQEPGLTADWSMPSGSTTHQLVDGSGLGLFDSGPKTPPASFAYSFFAAGTYRVVDQGTGRRMTVTVFPRASPKTGTQTTTFQITWASIRAGGSLTFDVEIRRPGTPDYARWGSGSRPRAAFHADAGPGVYSFRARVRDIASGARTGYSPPVFILVDAANSESPPTTSS